MEEGKIQFTPCPQTEEAKAVIRDAGADQLSATMKSCAMNSLVPRDSRREGKSMLKAKEGCPSIGDQGDG